MKNIFKYSPGFLAGVILSSAFAGAAAANSNLITNTIDELWVFVAGDPVLASQVNENFEYLESKIDEEVSFLSDDVIANTVSILNNEDGVGVNQSAISQVDSSLSSFQSSQSVRDGDQDVLIVDNGSRIAALENDVVYPGFSFTLGDLVGEEWDITFDTVSLSGSMYGHLDPILLSFTINNGSYEQLAVNQISADWSVSPYTGYQTYYPYYPPVQTGPPNSVFQRGFNGNNSIGFEADGTFVSIWKSGTNEYLELLGSMSTDKQTISGYFSSQCRSNTSSWSGIGTWVGYRR